MEDDFEALHPQKVRRVEVKLKKKGEKGKKGKKEKVEVEREGSESEDSELEEWVRKEGLGVIGTQHEWGNEGEGEEWINRQKDIHRAELRKIFDTYKEQDHKVTFLEFDKESPSLTSQPQKVFHDSAFPAVLQSLTGEWGPIKKYESVYWQRATLKLPACVVFSQKVIPQNIKQGKLGDCYFLSSLAALAERPDRIFNLFLVNTLNQTHRFSVKLLFRGRWQVIDIDEYFPFLKDQPVFSRSLNNELWAMILEKAWAKIYGCYMNIASGHAEQCLHDFTGAPIKFFKLKSKDLDKDKLWKYLLKASKREYAMCASSNAGSDTKMSETGIVQGHSYTLLNVTYLKYNDEKIKLVQLRNPWGRKEGHNKWHDHDPGWKQVKQQEKRRIGYSQNSKDGIFFMQYSDFLYEYRSITIAEINDNASYVYESAKDPTREGICFKIELSQTNRYSFQIDKTPKRSFSVKARAMYKYPEAYCKIYTGKPEYKKIHYFHDDDRLTSRKFTLDKGVYYVMVKIDFDTELETEYEVTLAIYSEAATRIGLAKVEERKKLGDVWRGDGDEKVTFEAKKKRYKSTPKMGEEVQLQAGRPVIRFNYNNQPGPLSPRPPIEVPAPAGGTNVQIKNKRDDIPGIKGVNPPIIQQQTILYPRPIPEAESLIINPPPLPPISQPQPQPFELIKSLAQLDWLRPILQQQSSTIEKAQVIDLVQNIKKQIIFLQPSPAQQKLNRLRQTKQEFVDDRFPPNVTSLCGEWGAIEEWKKVRWERISQVLPKSNIFKQKISPLAIKQGFLGDCYFLAGLAALAQKPERVVNLFLLSQRNQLNYYSVKLLYRGKWMTVDMDDNLPYMYDWPAFSNTSNGELWVVLLQKAWAKVYSSYKRIEAGFPEETLHDLTGAPIRHIYIQRGPFDPQQEWNYLMKASALEYAMVASSQVGSDSLKSVSGIVQGHAYTLLQVCEVSFKGQSQRLVQLRNPWGKGQNSSPWSDSDQNWSLIPESQKQRIGYANRQDGVFFLSYQLFIRQFKLITVAQINDNASYIYLSSKDQQKKGCFFTVTIHRKGKYSFQVDNTPERTFQNHYHTDYKYPQTSFQMGMITEKGYIWKMVGLFANARTLFHSAELDPNTYVCFVKTDYDSKFQKDFSINLAVYGDYPCKIELSTNREAIIMSNNPKVQWPRSQCQDNNEWNSLRGYKAERGRSKRRF